MAIKTFCTTFCTALATLASASALAMAPGGGEAPADPAVPHIVLSETNAFGKPAALAGLDAGNSLVTQLIYGASGDIALPADSPAQAASVSEPANLPLLAAAGIALLVAQLQRSRRPTL
ncbi:hypothetical protein [Massilia sp. METH4]|uniref:hypothetical protein n=1 Tax=Massilia sp. METH4 TaxID=3123041 RepID=UPI0030CD82F0